uniref:Uncharacterized protein n=1 Tax=Corethron hystrix TaxID=216773 RepID=A0A7S1BAS4_9STRA
MALVCRLELCILLNNQTDDETDRGNCVSNKQETSRDRGVDKQGSERFYLFPCLLPIVSWNEIAQYWLTAADADPDRQSAVYRGYRFRSQSGFFPPGLFPGLLARCRLSRPGVVRPERTWKNCIVLSFGTRTKVMLRIDPREGDAVLDVVGTAPAAEDLFVGAAKGQASVVIWTTHLVKMFLRGSYPQLGLDEFFLCPSAECHARKVANGNRKADGGGGEGETFDPCRSYYHGDEFPAVPKSGKRYRGNHNCEADGCWRHLGVGHKIETMVPKITKRGLLCTNCRREARFALRDCL